MDESSKFITQRHEWNNDEWKKGFNFPIEKSNFELEKTSDVDLDDNLSDEQITEVLLELKAEMENAAKQLDFEQAAKLRDRVFELEQLLLR